MGAGLLSLVQAGPRHQALDAGDSGGNNHAGVGRCGIFARFVSHRYDQFHSLAFVSLISLRFLPRFVRVLIFGGLGIGFVVYGTWGLNRALLRPFLRPGHKVIDQLSDFRRRDRGPRVVAIGGGHGLSTLLRGLKAHTRQSHGDCHGCG